MKKILLLMIMIFHCLLLNTALYGAMKDEDFLKFCASKTAEEIQAAIHNGASPNARDANGRTALIIAAGSNTDSRVIDVLVKSGIPVNAKDDFGMTIDLDGEFLTNIK